jgi:hypothetical protein
MTDTSSPSHLSSLMTIVVPAGRGLDSLTPLVESLRSAAAFGRYSPQPPLIVGVAGHADSAASPIARWSEAGAAVSMVAAAAGHATALRNAAITAVATPWIALLDDDVVVEETYLLRLEAICRTSADDVIQGVPYLCSNGDKLLARLEARNYEQGFATYYDRASNTVRIVDPRNLVMKTSAARKFPFDESLVFAGEGPELAGRLRDAGVRLSYCDALRVRHRNRSTLSGLALQKFLHGRGCAQRVRCADGIWNHARRSFGRHFLSPVGHALIGRASMGDAGYRLMTNAMFWCGMAYEAIQRGAPPRRRAGPVS